MEEKREIERKQLFYYLAVTDKKTGKAIGHMVDISNAGLMLISQEAVESNAIFQLKMFLPEAIKGHKYLEFSAESRWCKKDVDQDCYDIGFQFINVPPEGMQVIEVLINKFSTGANNWMSRQLYAPC